MDKLAFFVAVVLIVIVIAMVIIAWYNYRLKRRIIDSGPIDHDAIDFLKRLTDTGAEQPPGFKELKRDHLVQQRRRHIEAAAVHVQVGERKRAGVPEA